MNTARTTFRLVGMDDDNALFKCSLCGEIVPMELDENGDAELAYLGDYCPECGAYIEKIDLD